MKGETETAFQSLQPFTKKVLEQLKAEGIRFIQVKGYSHDKRLDYMEPYYMVLFPKKELAQAAGSLEIYEPIDSEILLSWAEGEAGIKVLVHRGG